MSTGYERFQTAWPWMRRAGWRQKRGPRTYDRWIIPPGVKQLKRGSSYDSIASLLRSSFGRAAVRAANNDERWHQSECLELEHQLSLLTGHYPYRQFLQVHGCQADGLPHELPRADYPQYLPTLRTVVRMVLKHHPLGSFVCFAEFTARQRSVREQSEEERSLECKTCFELPGACICPAEL